MNQMNTTPEGRDQLALLSLRSLLNLFPVAGPILNDIFFEFRSRVKQDRINHFVCLLEAEFSKMGVNLKTLKTEENLDLFEGIFKKVAESRSELKRIGFKNIMLTGLRSSEEIEYCEIFSDLLFSIRSKELEILSEHQYYLVKGNGVLIERNKLKTELQKAEELILKGSYDNNTAITSNSYVDRPTQRTHEILKLELEKVTRLLTEYKINCTAGKFELSTDEYKFFLRNLLSKGLLSDDGVGAIGTGSIEIMSLTKFGSKFLSFILK